MYRDNGKVEIIGVIQGLQGRNWGYIGIVEKKMETIGILGVLLGLSRGYRVYWGYIGIMEKKRETNTVYWEGQGDLVSGLITPRTHIVTLVILVINLFTKSP